MNERIKELADRIWSLDIEPDERFKESLQNFAELIVKECLNICQECIDDGCVEAEEPMWKIEQHFGVEE